MVQPAFHKARLQGYGAAMIDCAAQYCAGLRDGETRDMHGEMMRLALHIVGRTLFDSDVMADASEVGQALEAFFQSFNFTLLPFYPLLRRLPLPQVRRIEQARQLKAEREREVEEIFHEGMSRFDSGSLELASESFGRVLELSPGHMAATDYLQKIRERQASGVGSPVPAATGGAGRSFDAPPVATESGRPSLRSGRESCTRGVDVPMMTSSGCGVAFVQLPHVLEQPLS